MSHIEHSHSTLTMTGYRAKANGLVKNLRMMAANVLTAPDEPAAAAQIEEDLFGDRRMKVSRLPAIDACQTTIFGELRQREEGLGRSFGKGLKSRPTLFGLKERLNGLLVKTGHLIH